MNQNRFMRLLILPSTGGFFGIFGLSLLVMVVSALLYSSRSGLFYEYLFGAGSSSRLIETSQSTITVFNDTVFGNPTLNKILFLVFWMVVGLVVYIIVTGLGASVSSAEQAVEQSKYVHAQKLSIRSEYGLKFMLRIIGAGLFIMYLIILFKILLPFGVLCARIIAGDLTQPVNWVYALLGYVVLCGTFYIGLVILRLMLLRPRIFGGQDDLLEDEAQHHNI